jgi:CHAT domain-containing protein
MATNGWCNATGSTILSACETGIGGQFGTGQEILGMSYRFQERSARAVIASLWKVSDGGTQALMDAFYTASENGNVSKVEALRQAQITLITGNYEALENQPRGIVGVRQHIQESVSEAIVNHLNHPYYWAPFILIGNGL